MNLLQDTQQKSYRTTHRKYGRSINPRLKQFDDEHLILCTLCSSTRIEHIFGVEHRNPDFMYGTQGSGIAC